MIKTQNYFEKIKEIDIATLPSKLKEGYDFVKEVTENHSTWDYYNSDEDIKATIDQYLANLSDYLQGKHETNKSNEKQTGNNEGIERLAREIAKKFIWSYVERGDSVEELKKSMMGSSGGGYSAMIRGNNIIVDEMQGKEVNFSFPLKSIYNEIFEEQGKTAQKPSNNGIRKKRNSRPPGNTNPYRINTKKAKPVERIDDAVRFIKRYTLMHGKIKTDAQILTFINSLQRAIIEKRIRKTSLYAKEIKTIQGNLIKLYNSMGSEVEIKINDKDLKKYLAISGSEKVRLSVNYLKRYIGIQGKHIDKQKAQRIIDLMKKAVSRGNVTISDPYAKRMDNAYRSLQTFIDNAKKGDTLEVHQSFLNGIQNALDGCACCEKKGKKKGGLNGIDGEFVYPINEDSGNVIMNSMDFADLSFDTLGFTGKWKELIGDPAEGFTAMVTGPPKVGKSYLCMEFAGYLARHHGETLYVAKEEKLHKTLQQKLKEKNAQHKSLILSNFLPDDLSNYQFIFLDSVSKLGLSPGDLEKLKIDNPGKSFIHIFHVTKSGKFRGDNTFQHDVDIVIEIPEKGRAIQFGRYNQGGQMEIFAPAA